MYLQELDTYSDQLIGIALSGTGPREERAQSIASLSSSIGELAAKSWEREYIQYCPLGLRAASIVACAPSLQTLARSESHTLATAQEVNANFHAISSKILNTYELEPRAISLHAGDRVLSDFTGQLSEFDAMELFWWGLANGHRDPRTYVLPATKQEDAGTKQEVLNSAIDINVQERGKPRQPVQVKTSGSTPEIDEYCEDIAIVVISRLMRRGTKGKPRKLQEILVEDDASQLKPMHDRLWASIRRAEARVAAKEARMTSAHAMRNIHQC